MRSPEIINADFAMICKGDSMINARIFDGDIVYIRQQNTAENGQIVAARIGNDIVLRYVQFHRDHIILYPANYKYPSLVYWYEDMRNVNILGIAVAATFGLS